MSYVITAFFGKYLFSDGKMGMMGCPNIYKSSVSLVPKTAYLIDSIGFMFTKCQNRKSFIYNKLRDFRESLVKHCLCMLLYLSTLTYPLTSSAYFVIRLKNGRQVITPMYW